MLLDVSRAMRQPGEAIPFEHHDEIPPQEIFGETVTFDDVLLTGHFSGAEDNLRLWGTLTCTAHGHCAGCLKPVDYPVEVPFDENYVRLTRGRKMDVRGLESGPCASVDDFGGA